MRIVEIKPEDRTMTREQWKRLDGMLRKVAKKIQPEFNKALHNLVCYGTGWMRYEL